jgi:glycosyltransferase involved in cell wall biosynthesis
MKKLLIISTTFPRWKDDKIANFIYELAKELANKYEVHVLAPHSKNSKTFERMEGIFVHRFQYMFYGLEHLSQGVSILDVIERNKLNLLLVPLFVISGSLKIIFLQMKYHFNIVHNHWLIPFSPTTALLKRIFRYKMIITSHGGDILGFSKGITGKLVKKISRYAIKGCDHYTVVSSDIKRVAEKNFNIDLSHKLKIISMGIPYHHFSKARSNFEEDVFTIVFVGRLSEMKGVKYLIEAIGILKKQGTEFKCKIIGDGPERKNLESLVENLDIANLVEFVGFVQHREIPGHFSNASVFVGPSVTTETGYKEGFGLVFVEAMAAGLPVIGSRSGGITDTVKHLETGLLVEERDSEQIAKYILELSCNSSLREKLIMNGKKLAKDYSWQSIASQYSEIYEN